MWGKPAHAKPAVTTQPENGYIGTRILKINVGFIMSEAMGFSRKVEFSVPTHIKVGEDLILQHLYATLHLSHTKEGVLVRGRVETSIPDQCSRCMDDVGVPIEFDLEELFARSADMEMPYHIDEAGNIDLAPLVREEAFLHAPMVTPYDDNGRCLFCQRTFKELLAEYDLLDDDIDPRLAVLQKLQQQMKDEN